MKRNHYSMSLSFRIVLFLLLAMIGTTANARDLQQARQAAMQQMKKSAARKANRKGGEAIAVNPQLVYSKAKTGADPYYYVFTEGKNEGFTVVSGDDRLPAIVGYTANGDFNAEKLPDGLSDYLKAYQEFIDKASDEQISEAVAFKAMEKHTSVEPMITTQWHQREPYNLMCPIINDGIYDFETVTGCVATAIAQILNYWKYPKKLMADIPAYSYVYCGEKRDVPAIAAGEEYDWDNMLNHYNTFESVTEEQKKAVAKLMLHSGCAVGMNYAPCESSTNAYPETFTKYFGMDKETIRQLWRGPYTIGEWDKILYAEMSAGRPVYYEGQSSDAGHAFVVDGYRDGMYHVNWGWGSQNGYFDITILHPMSVLDETSYRDGYSMSNSMIIGIQPDNGIVDEKQAEQFSRYGEENVTNLTMADGVVTATFEYIIENSNDATMSKYVAVGYEKEDGSIQNITETPMFITLEGKHLESVSCNVRFNAENGKIYQLFAIESDDQNTWQPCLGKERSVKIKVENGKAEVVTKYILSATAELNKKSSGYAKRLNTISVTVNNSGANEYYKPIYIKISNSSEMPTVDTYTMGITIPSGESSSFEFAYFPESAGTYTYWILDTDRKEIGKGNITFTTSNEYAPKLSIASIKCINASNDKTFADYKGETVQMNKVYDTKAEFEFEIRNDGALYEGSFYYPILNENGNGVGESEFLIIPANSTVRTRVTAEGDKGAVICVQIDHPDKEFGALPLENTIDHVNKNGEVVYSFGNCDIVYLAGPEIESLTCDEFKEENVKNLITTDRKTSAVVTYKVANKSEATLSRYVAVGYEKEDGSIQNVTSDSEYLTLAKDNTETVTSNVSFTAENGKSYRLIVIESDDKATWCACHNKKESIKIKMTDNKASLLPAYELSASIALQRNKFGYAKTQNKIYYTINNLGAKDYNCNIGDIMVEITEPVNQSVEERPMTVSIPCESSSANTFYHTPEQEGTYIFRVIDSEGNELGKNEITYQESPLSYVSIKCTNVSKDEIYTDFCGSKVQMNKVYDTKADFELTIKNTGDNYEGIYRLTESHGTNNFFEEKNKVILSVPANETTTLRFTIKGDENTVVGLKLEYDDNDDVMPIMGLDKKNIHNIQDGGYFSFEDSEIVYLAGPKDPDGIADTKQDSPDSGDFYDLRDQKVSNPTKGIYIKNGKKYVFK